MLWTPELRLVGMRVGKGVPRDANQIAKREWVELGVNAPAVHRQLIRSPRGGFQARVHVGQQQLVVFGLEHPEVSRPCFGLVHAWHRLFGADAEALLVTLIPEQARVDGMLDDVDPTLGVDVIQEPLKRLAVQPALDLVVVPALGE
jgi:hypothetical protein